MSDNKNKLEKELFLARLEVLPSEFYFSDGEDVHDFSRDDMIKEVQKDTKVGLEFRETELSFLRALKDGTITKLLVSK